MVSELEAWVNKLGAMTAPEIRELMKVEGIRGKMGSPYSCPLANFLSVKTGNDVIVNTVSVRFHLRDRSEHFGTPESMRDFMAQFDLGLYRELRGNWL